MQANNPDIEILDQLADAILSEAGSKKVIAFTGPMGSGKTTLIKRICMQLGIPENQISSPTFGIVNEYSIPGLVVYHFDLYRLRTIEELIAIGFEEYMDSGNYCFIEWPELADTLLFDDTLKVTLLVMPDGKRVLSFA